METPIITFGEVIMHYDLHGEKVNFLDQREVPILINGERAGSIEYHISHHTDCAFDNWNLNIYNKDIRARGTCLSIDFIRMPFSTFHQSLPFVKKIVRLYVEHIFTLL